MSTQLIMPPFLSYSGRGGSQRSERGRGRGGRGPRRGSRFPPKDNIRHRWIRPKLTEGNSVDDDDTGKQLRVPKNDSSSSELKNNHIEVHAESKPKYAIMNKNGRNQLTLSSHARLPAAVLPVSGRVSEEATQSPTQAIW